MVHYWRFCYGRGRKTYLAALDSDVDALARKAAPEPHARSGIASEPVQIPLLATVDCPHRLLVLLPRATCGPCFACLCPLRQGVLDEEATGAHPDRRPALVSRGLSGYSLALVLGR